MSGQKQIKLKKLPEEFVGATLERVYYVLGDVINNFKYITFCFSDGRSLKFEAKMDISSRGAYPTIVAESGQWEMIKKELDECVDEGKPDVMVCCNCKLPKKSGVLVCKCCGGTIYEGQSKVDKDRKLEGVICQLKLRSY